MHFFPNLDNETDLKSLGKLKKNESPKTFPIFQSLKTFLFSFLSPVAGVINVFTGVAYSRKSTLAWKHPYCIY